MAVQPITFGTSPRGWTVNTRVYTLNVLTGSPLEHYGDVIADSCRRWAVDPNFVYSLLEVWQGSYRAYYELAYKNPFAMYCLSCDYPDIQAGQIACHPMENDYYCGGEYVTLVSGIEAGVKWLSDSINAGYTTWLELANWFLFGTPTPESRLGQDVVMQGVSNAYYYQVENNVKTQVPDPTKQPPVITPQPTPTRPLPDKAGPIVPSTDFLTIAAIALAVSLIITLGLARRPDRSEPSQGG